MTDPLRPGYCPPNALSDETPGMAADFIQFMREGRHDWSNTVIGDIGQRGYKSDQMRKHLCPVEQIEAEDFNWDILFNWNPTYGNRIVYDIISCFEVIEHVQNPLWLMREVKHQLAPGGSLYLSTPGRQKPFWSEHHFCEMEPDHLQKWILNPLGMYIVRKKRVRLHHPLWFYLTGIRPFLRIWVGYTTIYEIKIK